MAKNNKSYASKSPEELKKELAGLRLEVQKQRLLVAAHQSKKTDLVKILRRDIARILTAIHMKEVKNG